MNIVEYGHRVEQFHPICECLLRMLYGLPTDLVADCKITIRAGWRNQPAQLSSSAYIEQLKDEGRLPKERKASHRAFVVMGRKSGKDLLANLVASYEATVPKYTGWADCAVDPILVVHPNKDLADTAARKFRKLHTRLTLDLPVYSIGQDDWTGGTLLDCRGRPIVIHTTPNSSDFDRFKNLSDKGLVIWNDLALFEDPFKAFTNLNSKTRQVAFTTGEDGGFIQNVIDRDTHGDKAPLLYQVPTWEARPDMSNAAFLDIWKSSVGCHPPFSEERKKAERKFNIEWGAQFY